MTDSPVTSAPAGPFPRQRRRDAEVRLSVVLPVRGDAAEARAALAAQEHTGWWEVLEADLGEGPGLAAAVNRAARRASGTDLLLLLDGDAPGPGCVRDLAEALRRNSFVSALPTRTRLEHRWPVAPGAALAVRRSAFASVGGLDESLAGALDADLSWRLQAAGHLPAHVPAELHRREPTPRQAFRRSLAEGRAEAALYAKHHAVLPPRRLRSTLRGWLAVPAALPRPRPLAVATGSALGRLLGTLRHGRLYL